MKNHSLYYVTIIFATIITAVSCKKSNNSEPINDYKDYKFEEPKITGKTFYIDPVNGSADGDGSDQKPWRTLQEVIENGLIGDL
ncbi:MAG: hypothetical protein HC831_23880 [Chloroflexia bacterium]|nr:hypothetical protein [Chloroflexia bacterium]